MSILFLRAPLHERQIQGKRGLQVVSIYFLFTENHVGLANTFFSRFSVYWKGVKLFSKKYATLENFVTKAVYGAFFFRGHVIIQTRNNLVLQLMPRGLDEHFPTFMLLEDEFC